MKCSLIRYLLALTMPKSTPKSAPKLGKTVRSVQRFVNWVAAAMLEERISANLGKELNQSARAMLASLAQEHREAELNELRALVARSEAASEARMREDARDRNSDADDLKSSYTLNRNIETTDNRHSKR